MSRKDFELIAKTIRNMNINNKEVVANEMALALRQSNPRFNYDRFIETCLGGL